VKLRLIVAVSVAVVLMGSAGFAQAQVPQPGVWNATAGFGTFGLTVNSSSTAITQIAYHFQSWQCGGVTRSGGVTVTPGSGWPITDGQFSFQNDLSAIHLSMTIQGSFTSSTTASGSWSGNSYGTTCSGTWTASSGAYPPTVSAVVPAEGPVGGGTAVTITGTNFVAGQTTVTVGGSNATSVVVTSATQLTAVTPPGTAGGVTVAVTTPGGTASLPNGFTYLGGVNRRYFAEGAIIPGFFEVNIALVNPNPAMDAHVWLRFLREGATEVGHGVVVPALGRRTVRVNDIAVMGTPAYTAFSTVVESDVLVVADRTMVWDNRGYGSHAETSIARPAQTWYLAEGATHSGFDLYYLIQNPSPTAVTVQVTYLRPAPLAPVVRSYTVAASSRKTIYVNGEGPELAATDVSAVIQSLDPSVPIIVERAMYLTDGWGHQFGAGHESAGVTAPSTHWFLAEGATVSAFGSTGSFFDMYILIANPNAGAATVTMTYLLPDGTTVTKTLDVAANSRQTVYVNGVDARLADTPVSTVVTSTQPVIVERAMWWPGPTWTTWYEAHNSPGTTETGTLWALAEGESGGSRGVETYILIANTSASAGQAKVTLLFEDGGPAAVQTFDLLPNSRRTIYPPLDFAGAVPAGSHRRFASLIESLGTTPAQIVVERAMYSNDDAGVVWAAGTNAVGTKLK
jgi:hypothetical protein